MSEQNRTVGGWSVEQRDGRVIVQKAGAGGYAACETDADNIASAILAAFALDAADERDRMTRERDEDQGVIAVWRGRTQRAEDERDEALALLRKIAENDWAISWVNDAEVERINALLARREG